MTAQDSSGQNTSATGPQPVEDHVHARQHEEDGRDELHVGHGLAKPPEKALLEERKCQGERHQHRRHAQTEAQEAPRPGKDSSGGEASPDDSKERRQGAT